MVRRPSYLRYQDSTFFPGLSYVVVEVFRIAPCHSWDHLPPCWILGQPPYGTGRATFHWQIPFASMRRSDEYVRRMVTSRTKGWTGIAESEAVCIWLTSFRGISITGPQWSWKWTHVAAFAIRIRSIDTCILPATECIISFLTDWSNDPNSCPNE